MKYVEKSNGRGALKLNKK